MLVKQLDIEPLLAWVVIDRIRHVGRLLMDQFLDLPAAQTISKFAGTPAQMAGNRTWH